jgi:hypothetical protein
MFVEVSMNSLFGIFGLKGVGIFYLAINNIGA